jgi:DNA/RNA endonuclease YhcR with UshA esterase domain
MVSLQNLKQSKLIWICIFSSVFGLVLIYLAAASIQPSSVKIGEIDSTLIGKTVKTTGYIIYRSNHPAGHVFLTIGDGQTKIEVPLFAGFVNSLNENEVSVEDFRKGVTISVTGLVGEYKGQLQIVPRKPNDLKILVNK